MRIYRLNKFHWFVLILVAFNVTSALMFLPEKPVVNLHETKIYPPNLATIILINSAEYEAYVTVQKAKIVMLCYELGPFTEKEYVSAVRHHLISRKIDATRKTDTEKEKIGYWVYLEPERSRALGRLKVEEIKLLGLTDVVLLTQNNPRYAISLGFFRDKGFANRRLFKTQSLGLPAKMSARYKYEDYQWLVLKATTENDLTQHEWSNILQEYQGVELKTVDCQ